MKRFELDGTPVMRPSLLSVVGSVVAISTLLVVAGCGSSDSGITADSGLGTGGASAAGGADARDATGNQTGGSRAAVDSGRDGGTGGNAMLLDGAPSSDAGNAGDAGTTPPASPSDDAGVATPVVDGGACTGPGARFATSVVSHTFGDGQNYGQDKFPAPVFGPPQGGGACQGGTDVVSLGNGGEIALAFSGNAIVDGPGPDFIVFENAFGVNCDLTNLFAELATVSVSEDGEHWVDFPCTATVSPYGQCSGWHPVYANSVTNTIDPTDPAVAGGDPYDLADIGVERARYVKVTDRVDLTGTAGVYDLDAVAIVHPSCP